MTGRREWEEEMMKAGRTVRVEWEKRQGRGGGIEVIRGRQ